MSGPQFCFLHLVSLFVLQNRELRQSARQIVIWVRRETPEQPTPQRNATASQHISTTNKKPTTTTKPPPTAQQQQQPFTTATTATTAAQHATPSNSSNNNSTKLRPRTHSLPTSMPRSCAQKKSRRQQQQHLQHKRTSQGIKRHGNSVAASGGPGPVAILTQAQSKFVCLLESGKWLRDLVIQGGGWRGPFDASWCWWSVWRGSWRVPLRRLRLLWDESPGVW